MRYRATIYIDLWHESSKEASKELEKIVKSIPNSFSDGLIALPHGSDISLVQENPDNSV
tara:strand:+ start:250 stop:426 length:177 start_codon:yes stop_codon:yes gene_type:complete